MKNLNKQILAALCFAWVLVACAGSADREPISTIDVNAVQTYVVQTAELALTQTHMASSPTPLPSPTAVPPTETPSPSPLPSPTETIAVSVTMTSEPLTATLTLAPTSPSSSSSSTRVPPPGTGELVSLDDFEHGQVWFSETKEDYSLGYDLGGYRIQNRISGAAIYSVRSSDMGNVRLEVDVNASEAAAGDAWGVICRYVDDENYYAILIGPDNFYGIAKRKEGEFQYLAKDTGTDDEVFERDENDFVHLRADCDGTTLRVSVNDTMLLEVTDSDHTSGKVGMLVRHAKDPEWTSVLFDNFAIWQTKP